MSGQTKVISPHPLATQAGQTVLAAGGTAADAAVAVNAVLAVVYPHFCGLGGDAVWMLADHSGNAACLMGIGQAIEAAPIGEAIPTRGPGSVLTTAAAVDSWEHALRHWPSPIGLDDLLGPAITLAETGFSVSASQAHWQSFRAGQTAEWTGFDALFRPGGTDPNAGDTFTNPHLAESLKCLTNDGLRSFYDGRLAHQIIDGLNAAGVPMSLADLAATRTRDEMPLRHDYRGMTLLAPPPPTQGITTLQIMGILENFDLSSLQEGSDEHLHLVVEAVKRAFQDREALSDPDFCDPQIAHKLNDTYLAARALEIGPEAMPWPDRFRPADTVYFAVVDAEGRCASVLQSTYFDWGSGVVAGQTGILWQNRGAAFQSDPEHPNAIRPGKRPFYTLNPGIALEGGKPSLLYGTQGADGQPQTLAMILTRLIDYQRTASEALDGGRFLLGRTFSDSNDTLKLESHLGNDVIASLANRGHDVATIPAHSPLAGQAGVIRIMSDGSIDGAHDPRGG